MFLLEHVTVPPARLGWQCPLCSRIHAPHVDGCSCNLDLSTMQVRKPPQGEPVNPHVVQADPNQIIEFQPWFYIHEGHGLVTIDAAGQFDTWGDAFGDQQQREPGAYG